MSHGRQRKRMAKYKREQAEQQPLSGLLTDARTLDQDFELVNEAIARRWPVVEKQIIVDRLMDIIETDSVTMITKKGEKVEVTFPADANSVKAATVLERMERANQTDEHKQDDSGKQELPSINERRDRIAAIRARLGHSRLVIDATTRPAGSDSGSNGVSSNGHHKPFTDEANGSAK